jgi:uncharacterized protein YndB with AHSA1/START domain
MSIGDSRPAPPVEPAGPGDEPFRKWPWILAGAAYGLVVRALMELRINGGWAGAMSFGFLVGVPAVIGFITVYGSPHARTSLWRGFTYPFLPTLLMLFGCAITLLEGSICIAIMAPLFLGIAGLAGFFTSLAFRIVRPGRTTLGAMALLPLLVMSFESSAVPDTFHELRETIVVAAPPETVWRQIGSARHIDAAELPASLVHLIGVPRPTDAENRTTPEGIVRDSHWERGVHFTARIVDLKPARSISWRYTFAPDSFPPGTMDEHVVIGGKYLDLGDTTFNLRALPGERTELEVIGRYRLSTPINFYAVPAAELLGRDFLRTLLGFYRGRAERAAGA